MPGVPDQGLCSCDRLLTSILPMISLSYSILPNLCLSLVEDKTCVATSCDLMLEIFPAVEVTYLMYAVWPVLIVNLHVVVDLTCELVESVDVCYLVTRYHCSYLNVCLVVLVYPYRHAVRT